MYLGYSMPNNIYSGADNRHVYYIYATEEQNQENKKGEPPTHLQDSLLIILIEEL